MVSRPFINNALHFGGKPNSRMGSGNRKPTTATCLIRSKNQDEDMGYTTAEKHLATADKTVTSAPASSCSD